MKGLISSLILFLSVTSVLSTDDDVSNYDGSEWKPTTTPRPTECPKENNGGSLVTIQHETDCSKFYVCVDGEKVEQDCPEGLHFDPKQGTCDWPSEVNCQLTSIKPTTTTKSPWTSSAKPNVTTTSKQPPTTTSKHPPTTTSNQPPTTTSQVPPTTTSQLPPTTTSQVPPTTTSQVPPTTTSQAPPTTTSQAPPTTTSQLPPTTTSQVPPTTTSQAPPTTTSQLPPTTTSQVPPTTTSQVPPTTTSQAPPTTTSQLPPTTTSQAPPTTTSQLPPTTTSQAPPTTTSQLPPTTTSQAPPTTTSQLLPTTTSQAPPTTTSQLPPTTTSQAPPTTTSQLPPTTTSQAPPTTTSQVPPTTTTQAPPTTTSGKPSTTTTKKPGYPTSCPKKDPLEPIYLPHECVCNKYYLCNKGLQILQVCPDGLDFNPEIHDCDLPENAGCAEITTIPPTEPTTPIPTECPKWVGSGEAIHIAHETNCSLFYTCTNGGRVLQKCPEGLHFNPVEQVCDWPWNVNCTDKPVTTTTKTPPITTTTKKSWPTKKLVKREVTGEPQTTTESWKNPETCIGECPAVDPQNYTIILPNELCTKYCVCSNGQRIVMSCPPNLHFSVEEEVCTYPGEANCTGIGGITTTTSSTWETTITSEPSTTPEPTWEPTTWESETNEPTENEVPPAFNRWFNLF